MAVTTPTEPSAAMEELCGLVLELAGRSTGRMESARRHVLVLDAAVPYMTVQQRQEARRRITAIETKWGPMLPGAHDNAEFDGVPPITRVARWLSTRRTPERYLRVLYRAATRIADGVTSLSAVSDYAFARETDYVLSPVGLDSFKEWLIELRIARRASKGIYAPGALCEWWVCEMRSSKDKSSPYQACMEQAAVMQHGQRRPSSFSSKPEKWSSKIT